MKSITPVISRNLLDLNKEKYAKKFSEGNSSLEKALKKAHEEYDKYMQNHLTQAEKDYLEIMKIEIKEIDK